MKTNGMLVLKGNLLYPIQTTVSIQVCRLVHRCLYPVNWFSNWHGWISGIPN